MTKPADGVEVAVDLADLVEILTRKNAELSQQNTLLEAAVVKLRREAGAGDPATNGEVKEVVQSGPPT